MACRFYVTRCRHRPCNFRIDDASEIPIEQRTPMNSHMMTTNRDGASKRCAWSRWLAGGNYYASRDTGAADHRVDHERRIAADRGPGRSVSGAGGEGDYEPRLIAC